MVEKKKTSGEKKQSSSKPRKKSSKSKKRSLGKRLIIWAAQAFAIGVILITLFFLMVYFGFTGPVPNREQLQEIKNPLASELISEDGKVLGRYYIENRSYAGFKEISPYLINALIATEDVRFYEHRGIDEIALMRVLFKSILLQQEGAGGGSTLSQQIAKNLFPRKRFGPFTMPVNKLREAIIAYRLERVYTKEDILAMYFNTVPFGENIFGVEVACERFFSKKPSEVTISEAAIIVGMLKANNSYNPRKHPEKAKERRNIVIGQMVKYGYLSQAEGDAACKDPIRLNYRVVSYEQGPAPYFTERLKPQLLDWCENHFKEDGTPYNLYTDGLKIVTTLNADMQRYAETSVAEHMKKLQQVFDEHWGNRPPWGNDKSVVKRGMARSDQYKRLKEAGLGDEAIEAEMEKTAHRLLFNWDGGEQKEVSAIDSVKNSLRLLNAGFMAINPTNGSLKAYVGGINFRFFKYDHVRAQRQVGSTFKPFVYLTALENGISPDQYFTNEQKIYEDYNNWSPENADGKYGGYYSMRGALSQSINTIAVDVLMQTGISRTIELAKSLGIDSELPEYPTLALGAASIPLEEMVCAYATLANGGKPVKPYFLVRIEDAQGKVLDTFENVQESEPVVNPENCRIITQMLKSVVNDGTGRAIRSVYGIQSDFAGKTGTTQNQADGWFMGMTPELVAGAWVGGEDPSVHFRSLTYGQGAYMALPIVGGFFQRTWSNPRFASLQNEYFAQPDDEHMAMLLEPPYKEVLEIDRKLFDIGGIFKKDKEKERPVVQDKPQQEQQEDQPKEKEKVWDKIKNIFRKKK